MRGENKKNVTDGVQYAREQYQWYDVDPGQRRLPSNPHDYQQKQHRGATRNGQGPENLGMAYTTDENKKAAKATSGQQGQPNALWTPL